MKKINCIFLLMEIAGSIFSQNHFGVGYNYLYAPQWDRAIQTYNFSRPSLLEKQPLLVNGFAGYYSHGHVHQIECSWHYFRSAAENPGLNSVFNQHLIEVGYLFHHEMIHTFFDAGISAVGGFLFRRENGTLMKIDDKFPFAAGVGANLNFRYGLCVNWGESRSLSPFAGVQMNPYFFSPYSEGLLNQTKGLVSKGGAQFFVLEAGLYLNFTHE